MLQWYWPTLALEFQQRGYRVWATARNLQSLQDLADKNIQLMALDVNSESQVEEVVQTIIKTGWSPGYAGEQCWLWQHGAID